MSYTVLKNIWLSTVVMSVMVGLKVDAKTYSYTIEPFKVTDKNGKPVKDAKGNFSYKDFAQIRSFVVSSEEKIESSWSLVDKSQATFFNALMKLFYFARPDEKTNLIHNRYLYGQCNQEGNQINFFGDQDHKVWLGVLKSAQSIKTIQWNVRDDGVGVIDILDAVKAKAAFSIQIINPNDDTFEKIRKLSSLEKISFESSDGNIINIDQSAGLNDINSLISHKIPELKKLKNLKKLPTDWSSAWPDGDADNRPKIMIQLIGVKNSSDLNIAISAQYNHMDFEGPGLLNRASRCGDKNIAVREYSLSRSVKVSYANKKSFSDIKSIMTAYGKYEFPVPLTKNSVGDFIFYMNDGFVDHGTKTIYSCV